MVSIFSSDHRSGRLRDVGKLPFLPPMCSLFPQETSSAQTADVFRCGGAATSTTIAVINPTKKPTCAVR